MFQQTAPQVNHTLNEFEEFVLVPLKEVCAIICHIFESWGGAHLTSSILLHSSAKFL